MGALNQEVSEITKGLHHMMHLLQARVSVHHQKASFPSYSFGGQMGSSPPTASSSDMLFNRASAYHLHNDPGSHIGQSYHSAPTGQWSYSGSAESPTEGHHQPQASSPPTLESSDSRTTHLWTSPSLHSVGPGFQGGGPGRAPHTGHEDSASRPLSASPTAISQSQPTLCLQPPSDSDEFSCLLSSAPTGLSSRSLLDASPSSVYHRCLSSEPRLNISEGSNKAVCALIYPPTSHNLIHDSHPFSHVVPSSPPVLPCQPSVSSLDSGSPRSDVLEPHLPLGNPSAIENTSLECLLGNGGSMESRDSESVSSRRSSIGVQTQSTEQSWCLDLTD